MSNIYQLPRKSDALDESSAWLARLDRGLSDQEQHELQVWLASAPENSKSLLEMAKYWDKLDSLSRLADMFPQTARQQSLFARFMPAMVIPVAIILLLVVGTIFVVNPTVSKRPPGITDSWKAKTYQTAIGEHSTVHLRDGSELTLNTNSLVKVTFTKRRRLLFLNRGEVYVQVAHDKTRPLEVYVGDSFVRAVGTAFNLRITRDKHIELIVTKGRVLVGAVDRGAANETGRSGRTGTAADTSLPVSAGEQIMLDGDEEIREIKPEDINVKLSWRGGNLIFRGELLGDALAEIERYTPVEFVIRDEDLKKTRIVGLFKAGDVEGLLMTLRQNFDISYERVNDKKVILRDK